MFADEQIIKADVGTKKLVDEKTLLVRRLEEVEKEVQLYKQCEEFLQRMSRLDKYLQAPDQASDYEKYELAVAALSAVKAQLSYVSAQRSQLWKFLCFLGSKNSPEDHCY